LAQTTDERGKELLKTASVSEREAAVYGLVHPEVEPEILPARCLAGSTPGESSTTPWNRLV
jgi:hypothetical protein